MENIDKNALFKFTYGLYVFASANDGLKSGFIGNAVMQLTSNPIQIAVCASKNNFTTELIRKSKKITISALDINTPKDIISNFGYKSGKDFDKFSNVKHIFSEDNIPIFTENTLAYFCGDIISEQDLDSHFLFIVKINNCEILNNDTQAITYQYYRDVYKGHSPKNAPTYVEISQDEIQNKNINNLKFNNMDTTKQDIWICDICGYEYNPAKGDPDSGIAPGTAFEDISDSWICPICGVGKSDFKKK